jgi:hypothetical protein
MSPAQQSIVDLVEALSGIEDVAEVDITLSELEKNVLEQSFGMWIMLYQLKNTFQNMTVINFQRRCWC